MFSNFFLTTFVFLIPAPRQANPHCSAPRKTKRTGKGNAVGRLIAYPPHRVAFGVGRRPSRAMASIAIHLLPPCPCLALHLNAPGEDSASCSSLPPIPTRPRSPFLPQFAIPSSRPLLLPRRRPSAPRRSRRCRSPPAAASGGSKSGEPLPCLSLLPRGPRPFRDFDLN